MSLASVCARFYIRLRVQKEFSIDDGFLLFGTGCLIAAMVVLFILVDEMYTVQALLFGSPTVGNPFDLIELGFWYRKMSAVSLILSWLTIVAVKFSFLALFKRLIHRMRPMIIYWWVVVAFNVAVAGYGAAVYILACPYFYDVKSCRLFALPLCLNEKLVDVM